MKITIAVDAMGGDSAPDIVVHGVSLALLRYPDVKFILYGDKARLDPLIKQVNMNSSSVTVQHASEVVASTMKPSAAIRNAKGSSMRLAIESVAAGDTDAVVSAGNTGAYMAMSKVILRTIKGIQRPALASLMPTTSGKTLMLDLGANVEYSADNLTQFALMGEVFSKYVLGVKSPAVGLLNVGAEDIKGHSTIQTTSQLLREANWIDNFYGFIEGNDILAGTVDVVVTDGFTGNVALKTAEGTYRAIKSCLDLNFNASIFTKIGYLLVRSVLKKLRTQFDPRQHNGAIFLGLNGVAVKSHGGTDAVGFSYAVGVAIDMASREVNEHISKNLAKWHTAVESEPQNDKPLTVSDVAMAS